MGRIIYWLAAAVVFGIVSGALYTWMSPRRSASWLRLWLTSTVVYTVIAAAIVYVMFLFV